MLIKLFIFSQFVFNDAVFAHSFDERYDLPIPFYLFIAGGGLVVALSFLLISFSFWHAPIREYEYGRHRYIVESKKVLQYLTWPLRIIGLILFFFVIGAAFFGQDNPLLNLAPNFIWIIWWLGLSLCIALFGNIWPLLDPWRSLYQILNGTTKIIGLKNGVNFNWTWPATFGVFPATVFLLAWSRLEVVYPIAFVPYRVGCLAMLWTGITIAGMVCFGQEVWLRNGDVFSIYFSLIGKFGIFSFNKNYQYVNIQYPSIGILYFANCATRIQGITAFIMAMLSTVIFDGLHGNQVWVVFERGLSYILFGWTDINGYYSGTLGLLAIWGIFYFAFYFSCYLSTKITPKMKTAELARYFSATFIPIAIAYLIAHNFSSLVIQGQNIVYLISDPFLMGWNLFGTKEFRPNIAVIDAGFMWYLAVGAIVLGHVIAVYLSHLLAMQLAGSGIKAMMMNIPQTVLMIAFTMLSLIIIAEPMLL